MATAGAEFELVGEIDAQPCAQPDRPVRVSDLASIGAARVSLIR